jgi:aryl-alcohol dehydrogenase-like predicted oxidoreductase
MKHIKLGKTGLDVSPIFLGCMSFGGEWEGRKWLLNEEKSLPILKKALDLGINFFDTANCYSFGVSEEILGRAIKDFAKRENVVIATKVRVKMRDGPNGEGLSRKAIMQECENSLKRLGMDYIDLYIIHRWDYNTPIEETMCALNDLVRSGILIFIVIFILFLEKKIRKSALYWSIINVCMAVPKSTIYCRKEWMD